MIQQIVPIETLPMLTPYESAETKKIDADGKTTEVTVPTDDHPAVLRKGEIVEYAFSSGSTPPGMVRDYFVVARGHYEPRAFSSVPSTFALYQNYPNPFNPSTTIAFDLPQTGHVKLSVYNILGQELATLVDEERATGHYEMRWNGRDATGQPVASGVYLYRIDADKLGQSRKMLMVK